MEVKVKVKTRVIRENRLMKPATSARTGPPLAVLTPAPAYTSAKAST
jgi:hypothetical protein